MVLTDRQSIEALGGNPEFREWQGYPPAIVGLQGCNLMNQEGLSLSMSNDIQCSQAITQMICRQLSTTLSPKRDRL